MSIILYTTIFLMGLLIGFAINLRINEEKNKKNTIVYGVFIGLLFILYAISIGLSYKNVATNISMYFMFGIIYILDLLIIAKIDKKNIEIKKPVVLFGFIITALFVVYKYFLEKDTAIYRNVLYMIITSIILIIDVLYQRYKGKSNYTLNILLISAIMTMFTNEGIYILTACYTLLTIGFILLIKTIKNRNKKYVKKEKKEKTILPIGFYMCIGHIIIYIFANMFSTYIL